MLLLLEDNYELLFRSGRWYCLAPQSNQCIKNGSKYILVFSILVLFWQPTALAVVLYILAILVCTLLIPSFLKRQAVKTQRNMRNNQAGDTERAVSLLFSYDVFIVIVRLSGSMFLFTNWGLAWNTTNKSVSTLDLIVRLVLNYNLFLEKYPPCELGYLCPIGEDLSISSICD